MCDNANTGGNQPEGNQIKKMKAISKHTDKDGKIIKLLYVATDASGVPHEIFDKQGDVLIVHSGGDGGRTLHDASDTLFASMGVDVSDIPEIMAHFSK